MENLHDDHAADGAVNLDLILSINVLTALVSAQCRPRTAGRFVPKHRKYLEKAQRSSRWPFSRGRISPCRIRKISGSAEYSLQTGQLCKSLVLSMALRQSRRSSGKLLFLLMRLGLTSLSSKSGSRSCWWILDVFLPCVPAGAS